MAPRIKTILTLLMGDGTVPAVSPSQGDPSMAAADRPAYRTPIFADHRLVQKAPVRRVTVRRALDRPEQDRRS